MQYTKDYLRPLLHQNPGNFISHAETNDLKSQKSSKPIAKEIMNIAVFLKSKAHNVSVSNIIVCTNKLKAIKANKYFKDFYKDVYLFIHSFIHSFIYLFIYSFHIKYYCKT